MQLLATVGPDHVCVCVSHGFLASLLPRWKHLITSIHAVSFYGTSPVTTQGSASPRSRACWLKGPHRRLEQDSSDNSTTSYARCSHSIVELFIGDQTNQLLV